MTPSHRSVARTRIVGSVAKKARANSRVSRAYEPVRKDIEAFRSKVASKLAEDLADMKRIRRETRNDRP